MKISNELKYYAIIVGSYFSIIITIVNYIGFVLSFITNFVTHELYLVNRITSQYTVLVIVTVLLTALSFKLSKDIMRKNSRSKRYGKVIMLIGILLFSFGVGDYIGPSLIILGGFAFMLSEGTLVIGEPAN